MHLSIKPAGLVIVLLLAACSHSKNDADATAAERVHVVRTSDAHLRDVTGVGIYAIGLLAQADGDTYLLDDALTPRQRTTLQLLSGQGYIKLDRINAEDGLYVTYSATAQGQQLVDALR